MLRCAQRLTPLKGIMDEKNCSSTLFCTLTTLHGTYNLFSTTMLKVTLCSKWHLNNDLLECAAASWAFGRWLGPGVPPPGWKIRLVFSCCHCCWFWIVVVAKFPPRYGGVPPAIVLRLTAKGFWGIFSRNDFKSYLVGRHAGFTLSVKVISLDNWKTMALSLRKDPATKSDELLEKCQGGGVIFNPKIYIADFGYFKQVFFSMKLIQKSKFRV